MDKSRSTIKDLLNKWHNRARSAQNVHYDAGRYYNRWNLCLGIPAVALSGIVGSAVIATLEKEIGINMKLFIALLSIGAAVLTGFQTFLRFSERSEKHRQTGARYGAIAREIERLLTIPEATLNESNQVIDAIRLRLDSLSEEAPVVPNYLWRRAKHQYEQTQLSQ
jgi:hypothetical protein